MTWWFLELISPFAIHVKMTNKDLPVAARVSWVVLDSNTNAFQSTENVKSGINKHRHKF